MDSTSDPSAPGIHAFDAWCADLRDELTIDPTPADTRAWLWDLFTHNGSLPADMVAPLVLERRLNITNQALAQLLDAARTDLKVPVTLAPHIRHPDHLEPAGQVTVHIEEILSLDSLGVFQQCAEALQDFLAVYHQLVWPVCPDHRLGTHPCRTDDGVAWTCASGPHTVQTMTAPAAPA